MNELTVRASDQLAITAAPSSSTAPRFAMLTVEGIARGRFDMTDGRPRDYPWQAAEVVAHFEPGTVPILTAHGGDRLGDLETLRADGADLLFTGYVEADAELGERIRRGVSISAAFVDTLARRHDGRPQPGAVPSLASIPHFGGVVASGRTLVEIAIEDHPAARHSFMWTRP